MSIDVQSNAKRIRALENRTYIPYSRLAEEAKKLKMNGSMLTIDGNGDLNFTKNMLCKNVTADNNIKIEKNAGDISNINDEIAVIKDTKADVEHTHKVSDLTDYINDISQRLLLYTQVKNYGISVYGDAIIKASGSLKYNGTNVSLEGHTHTISEITDYEPYEDTELRTLINSKADNNHTHTEINGYKVGMQGYIRSLPYLASVERDGVMEVGKYIDFHTQFDDSIIEDAHVRLTATNNVLVCNKNFIAPNIPIDLLTRLEALETKISKLTA